MLRDYPVRAGAPVPLGRALAAERLSERAIADIVRLPRVLSYAEAERRLKARQRQRRERAR